MDFWASEVLCNGSGETFSGSFGWPISLSANEGDLMGACGLGFAGVVSALGGDGSMEGNLDP